MNTADPNHPFRRIAQLLSLICSSVSGNDITYVEYGEDWFRFLIWTDAIHVESTDRIDIPS